MFDKSKIIWHLTQMEIAAGTDQRMREVIAEMATKTGAMDRAVNLAKESNDRALGSVYLVTCVCELALEKNAPQQLIDALEDLLFASIDVLEARYKEDPPTGEMLQHRMMQLEERFLARKSAKAPSPTSAGPTAGPTMPTTGNMPDVTKRQPSRAFQAGRYLMLFLKDVPPIAEQIGPNPMGLRFAYVLAIIDSESRQPVYFVTLENSMMGANFLSTIDSTGAHGNLGSHPNLANEPAFIDWAVELAKQYLAIDDVREVR